MGLAAIASIVASREARGLPAGGAQAGRFRTMDEMCRHVDLRLVNRKVCESLIKAGACDSMGFSRAALLAGLDQVMEEATSLQKDVARGQFTFFEELAAQPADQPSPASSAASRLRDWPESQKLAFEKALLGFYVSGHPLARHERMIRMLASAGSQQLLHVKEGAVVTIGGMLTKIKLTTTKKTNEQMAVCMLEDLEGDVELLIFPNSFSQLAPQLKPNAVVFVEARLTVREDQPRLIAQQIVPIEQGPSKLAQALELHLHAPVDTGLLEQLKTLLATFPGTVPVYMRLEIPEQGSMQLKLSEGFKVDPKPELVEALTQLLGDAGVSFQRQRRTLDNVRAPVLG